MDCSKHTHSDLHRQQSLACVFGIDGELDGERGGHPSGVETRSAGPHLTGIVGGKHLDLVGAAWVQRTGGFIFRLGDAGDDRARRKPSWCRPAWDLLISIQHVNGIGSFSGGDVVDCVGLVSVVHHLHRLHHT